MKNNVIKNVCECIVIYHTLRSEYTKYDNDIFDDLIEEVLILIQGKNKIFNEEQIAKIKLESRIYFKNQA